MKTIKKWLETLEEPYRSEALVNMDYYSTEVRTLSDALDLAFPWEETIQGRDYWDELHDELLQKENEN